ncbi:short-chain dehydrogenase [Auricularia subglabra TFB-10046 SS5]|nr:short-chain dehydrogenase [Auricularia subglabra TFB-10046 SS5]
MSPTVIITGASRGIGLAAAQFLLDDGAQVVTVQRSATPELAALADKFPTALRNIQGDCSDTDVISRTIQAALNTFGAIDAVVFNAATFAGSVGPVARVPLEEWRNVFDVNLFGVVRFVQAVLPALTDGGRIISVSSGGSETCIFATGAYSASKAALNSLTRTLAVEHPSKISVALHPGPVRTEMQQGFTNDAKAYMSVEAIDKIFEGLLEPEVPGRVISDLALRAGPAFSGKYLHWNDPSLEAL